MGFLNSIKICIYTFVLGVCIGVCACAFFIYKLQPKADPTVHITSQTISGSPLVVGKITSSGNKTTVNTNYSGKGESNIIIPDSSIPHAKAYNEQIYLLGASISTDKTFSVLGGYRYHQIIGIGSLWYRNQNTYQAGASIGILYMFDL